MEGNMSLYRNSITKYSFGLVNTFLEREVDLNESHFYH
jgi:hypothetical protein